MQWSTAVYDTTFIVITVWMSFPLLYINLTPRVIRQNYQRYNTSKAKAHLEVIIKILQITVVWSKLITG